MRYVVEGLNYPQFLELQQLFKNEKIESEITLGGLAVYTNRINKLKEIVSKFPKAYIVEGKSYLESLADNKEI